MTNALNHGFSIAFWFGAVFAAIGCLIAFLGMDSASARVTGAIGSEPANELRLDLSPADIAE